MAKKKVGVQDDNMATMQKGKQIAWCWNVPTFLSNTNLFSNQHLLPALRVNDYVTMKQTPNYRTFNDLNSHKQPTMYQDSWTVMSNWAN